MINKKIRKRIKEKSNKIITDWCNFLGEEKSSTISSAEWVVLISSIRKEMWKELVEYNKDYE
jgi:hypothetical protein